MSETNTSASNPPIPEERIGEFQSLIDIVARLRGSGGCPWDAEQTHESLKRNLLEECYETLEAIDGGQPLELAEELGDILVQVAFHADIARAAGEFDIADVLTAINRKLVRRHPHVFADGNASDARQVERNWEQLKAEERRQAGKPEPSAMDSVPAALPALTAAQLIQDRAARFGFDWDDAGGVLDKLVEEIGEFRAAATPEERADEFGDILFAIVNLARWSGIQAEDALRQANNKFRNRYRMMERLATERGLDFTALPLDDKEALWQEAKARDRSEAY
ncbi:MAG: nucleoside triphosphate pyrophosphohydrolase [Dehalococcoidia bacterium]|nr:nucleoside triphosphate pyrophosphohydrolase [Dehalococcoidia bacterium]